jgi:V/A-type H+/Na+-transporting ATPase subunit F
MKIAVVGSEEFSLGFQLAGIREIASAEAVAGFLSRKDLGIVILDEATMTGLDQRVKEEVLGSISPVFLVVSEQAQQEELRKMIRQSIGVDLMKGE